jgi:hypothetical protein
VRALPKPPDAAFLLCVFALIWASLWRGALRWCGLLFFAAGFALYVVAPLPTAAFDADLRAIFIRADEHGGARWTLIAGRSRSTFVQERLGAMLGLSPANLERLAPPEACGVAHCVVRIGDHARLVVVRTAGGFDAACIPGVFVVARLEPPADFAARCRPAALSTPDERAEFGGAMIYVGPHGWRLERAWPGAVQRPWTPRAGGDPEAQD